MAEVAKGAVPYIRDKPLRKTRKLKVLAALSGAKELTTEGPSFCSAYVWAISTQTEIKACNASANTPQSTQLQT